MEYDYSKMTRPNLTAIHEGVTASAMLDKSIEGCRWDEEQETLKVFFTGTLSSGDKTIIDGIVEGV